MLSKLYCLAPICAEVITHLNLEIVDFPDMRMTHDIRNPSSEAYKNQKSAEIIRKIDFKNF